MKKKMIEASRTVQVGIYDNCVNTIRCYEDRTICHISGVRWVGNTGSYHKYKIRITGHIHNLIRAALLDGCEDSAWAHVEENGI